MLARNGTDPNKPDGMGQTPLHFAAEYGHTDACRLLIERGAGPSLKVLYYDQSPREWAERKGFHKCASVIANACTTCMKVKLVIRCADRLVYNNL